MIHLFTKLLKDYLVRQGVVPADRIMLGPPDRAFVGSLPQGQSVNIYLADIRENRKLRTNERGREDFRPGSQTVKETLYPAWLDAHYLITAWDTSIDQSIRAIKEHELLAGVSAELLAGDPFTPREVYPDPTDAQLEPVATARQAAMDAARQAGKTPDEIIEAGTIAADQQRTRITNRVLAPLHLWPEEFYLPGLPYQVLPQEGFPKLSEFWTTMGTGSAWKPVVYLLAAIPIALKTALEYPMVTTMRSTTGQTSNALDPKLISGTERNWFQIGGFVSKEVLGKDGNSQNPRVFEPVKRAKTILQTVARTTVPPTPALPLQETRTDDKGRYQFLFGGPLSDDPTKFQVVVQVPGLQAPPLNVVLTPAEPFPHDVLMQSV